MRLEVLVLELINIYPIKNLGMYNKQHMNMFLTHLVFKDKAYRDMSKNHEGYKILDNSLIELDGALSMRDVLNAAKVIEADEVVLPDVYMDGEATIESTAKALKEYEEELKQYKTMAVVHGKTEDEFFRTFMYFSERPDIDVLGIPKVMHEQFTSNGWPGRPDLLGKVIDLTDKDVHLLGLWNSFDELRHYGGKIKKIRSIDTSLPSLLELNKRSIFSERDDCEQSIINLQEDKLTNEGNTEGARKYVKRIVDSI